MNRGGGEQQIESHRENRSSTEIFATATAAGNAAACGASWVTMATGIAGTGDTRQHSAPEAAFTGAVFAGQQECAVGPTGCHIAAQAASGCTKSSAIRSTVAPSLRVEFIDSPNNTVGTLEAIRPSVPECRLHGLLFRESWTMDDLTQRRSAMCAISRRRRTCQAAERTVRLSGNDRLHRLTLYICVIIR
jgi:hypothetical protein